MEEKLEYQKIKIGEDIYDEVTGEITAEAREIEILTRKDVPFRSITDLKGYDDSELNTMPSMTNTKDYVPIKKTIAMVLKNHSLVELEMIAEQQKQFGDYDIVDDDEGDDVDSIGDSVEAVDYFEGHQAIEAEQEEFQQSAKEALTNDAKQSESIDEADADTLD